MFRRALLVLATAGSLVALTAVPASAAADPMTCNTYTQTATSLTICIDVTANERGIVMFGTAPVGQATLNVHRAELYQCGATSCPIAATGSGTGVTQWSGAYAPFAFGHSYIGCAEVTITWGVVVQLSAYYSWPHCSGERIN